MITWTEFSRQQPALADAGRRQFYQFGIGLAFLGTVRPDGAPRVHPVCPVISDAGLHLLIVAGPKRQDLRRDGRYALHSDACPPPRQDDGFALAGQVREVTDAAVRQVVRARVLAERGGTVWPSFGERCHIRTGHRARAADADHGRRSVPGRTHQLEGRGRARNLTGGSLRYCWLAVAQGSRGLGSGGKDHRHDEPCSG